MTLIAIHNFMGKAMEVKDGEQPIKGLLIETSFPALANDITIAKAQIEASGSMPPADGLSEAVVCGVSYATRPQPRCGYGN